MKTETINPDCNTCTRRKHCFVKEFKVLSCEDYKPENEEGESDNAKNQKGNIQVL